MHKEILHKKQVELLPLITQFTKQYYLVGGTAIALYIGHRHSIDFDLFTENKIQRRKIKNIIIRCGWEPDNIIYEAFDQMHLIVNNVKITFFLYPHKIDSKHNFDNIIKLPELIDLAAMKAYALGGRAKWKDYVDVYFLLKKYFSFSDIAKRAKQIFGSFFNEKLFKEQLSYFTDVDYSEEVEFMPGYETGDFEIKQFLTEIATRKI
ncbi:MAG: nucleotidyl transferase AbiEii/AbiGii toxin family protein [Bacteroidales bacterium]|nr:nucleotidyl transferase AbiEii/AbiGii toxin family protein [Bacteroidales bacterium]